MCFQINDQAGHGGRRATAEHEGFSDGLRCPISTRHPIAKVLRDFEKRPTGYVQELGEFAMAIPPEAFRDVARDGAHGGPQLMAKIPIID